MGNSLKFQAKTEKPGDFWIYPAFTLQPGESLSGVESMTFEVRAVQNDPEAGYKLSTVQFQPGNRQVRFPAPPKDGSWEKVELNLAKAKIDFAAVKTIQIGFNPKSPGIEYEVRNIQFSGALPKTETRPRLLWGANLSMRSPDRSSWWRKMSV